MDLEISKRELAAAKVANGSRLLIPVVAAEEWLVAHTVVPRETKPRGHRFRRSRPAGRPLGDALASFEQPRDAD